MPPLTMFDSGMDSLAPPAFFYLPNPSVVICARHLIRAANLAAEQIFERSDWAGDTASGNLPLAKLHIQLEINCGGWKGIMERAAEHKANSQNVSETGLAELPPHEETAFRLRRQNGNIVANLSVSAWDHAGETFYTICFYRRRRHQYPPADFPAEEPSTPSPIRIEDDPDFVFDSKRAKELAHLKSALHECGPRYGVLLSGDGRNCYLNSVASDLVDGTRFCNLQWLQDSYPLWDADFTHLIPREEWPQAAAKLQSADIPEKHYGFIMNGKRIILALESRCLLDPVTGIFIGSFCFANGDGTRDWFSKQWREYTGLTLADCIGDGWMKAIHPDDLPRYNERRLQGLKDEMLYEDEVRCRRSPIKCAQGKVLRWYGTNTDVHDSVVARLKARRERAQMVKVWAVSKGTRQFTVVEGNSFYTNASRRKLEPWLVHDKAHWNDALASFDLSQDHLRTMQELVDKVMDARTPAGEAEVEIDDR
ncbi:hypothetical protein LTR37_014513 [Vermiconidia calcicola]|uniref:Uncharacterized protein n=1 Tax=Vermiconidia calcicola TaxID=1690605 RepID=A0ACC3MTG0_9PEZI|nr:hypothetical protein LTR37_014513 [Vermiconidia calcicola]